MPSLHDWKWTNYQDWLESDVRIILKFERDPLNDKIKDIRILRSVRKSE